MSENEKNKAKHIKLLLVDDEVRFLSTTKKLLAQKGYDVMTASSGAEALEIIRAQNIEVVILDVKMPGMDGIEALQEIKNRYPLVEVIMLTGHATVGSAIDGMKWGAFDYLMKPCDIDNLIFHASEAAAKKRQHENKIIEARMKRLPAG